ncbi:MAG: flagellar protein FliT [Butyrivibrio sp.]|nr:flagellar protein FliT [Butyrivibrio sp.]
MLSASLDMLEESLKKKIEVMTQIEEENQRQKELLLNPEEVELAAFDETVDRKGELIDKLLALDDGFQTLFEEVKKELGENRSLYADQIKRMQDLIREITAKSASIEAMEHRNKKLAENYFEVSRNKMAAGRQSSAAAYNYYVTMNNYKDVPPQFLDNKQ